LPGNHAGRKRRKADQSNDYPGTSCVKRGLSQRLKNYRLFPDFLFQSQLEKSPEEKFPGKMGRKRYSELKPEKNPKTPDYIRRNLQVVS